MKKKVLIPLIIIGIVITALIVYSAASESDSSVDLMTGVESGDFEIVVAVTGELQAESSVEIRAPSELRSRGHRLRSIKIQNLVDEGTVVDSGDWVATLDRSEAANTLKDKMDELEMDESDYLKTKLDTTIQLRQLRDELINLKFNMEEQEILLEQSQYEPPATIRQARINLDKAKRAYEQALQNYQLKVQQAEADMREVTIELAQERRETEEMKTLLEKFEIYAPASGMVIYKKEWGGQKRTVGSEINPWDLTVATLPDLSTLVSKTYVNEIDISKVARGQKVRIGVDAFPEKSFTGEVTEVANIGEQLPNTDAKVFEVAIRLNERDPILRPSMTTSNQIITRTYDDVLYIPLEAVHTDDSISFVYTANKNKQIVLLGQSNENSIIVEEGLEPGQEIYLSLPGEPESFKLAGKEFIDRIEEKREADKEKVMDSQDEESTMKRERGERSGRQGRTGKRKNNS